jgi:hypothetical protein
VVTVPHLASADDRPRMDWRLRHLRTILAPSFSRRANVAMMPAHVARFAPDATAQVGVSCLGYKAHFIATVAPAATWCGEIIQENLSQGSPNSLPKSSIRRKFSFSLRRGPAGGLLAGLRCGRHSKVPRHLEGGGASPELCASALILAPPI